MAGSGDQREWVTAPLPLNVEILPVAQRQERKVLPLRTPVRIPPGRPQILYAAIYAGRFYTRTLASSLSTAGMNVAPMPLTSLLTSSPRRVSRLRRSCYLEIVQPKARVFSNLPVEPASKVTEDSDMKESALINRPTSRNYRCCNSGHNKPPVNRIRRWWCQ